MNSPIIQKEDNTSTTNWVLLFALVYMVSYITRINYGAIISEMVSAEHLMKSEASLALTGSFITYGAGQLISGYMGDKIQPKILIFSGLLLTGAMNILIPICTATWQMVALWCVNGFAQAFMWPPLVKLMTALVSEQSYGKACMRVSWGSSLGTILVYLISPIIISLFSWRAVFIVSAFCAIATAVFWMFKCCNIELNATQKYQSAEGPSKSKVISIVLIAIMAAIILQGALRDGVATWMPSYISETFGLGSSISILTGVVLPIFGIVCIMVATWVNSSLIHNELVCAGTIFAIGFVSASVLAITNGENVLCSVLFSALLNGSMHGVNMILICIVPGYYRNTGKVSMISGLVNSCTYIGAAISTWGIAVYSEAFGWEKTVILWAIIAMVGMALCLIFAGHWKRFKQESH